MKGGESYQTDKSLSSIDRVVRRGASAVFVQLLNTDIHFDWLKQEELCLHFLEVIRLELTNIQFYSRLFQAHLNKTKTKQAKI